MPFAVMSMADGIVVIVRRRLVRGRGHLAMHRAARNHGRRGVPLKGERQRNDPNRECAQNAMHEPILHPARPSARACIRCPTPRSDRQILRP